MKIKNIWNHHPNLDTYTWICTLSLWNKVRVWDGSLEIFIQKIFRKTLIVRFFSIRIQWDQASPQSFVTKKWILRDSGIKCIAIISQSNDFYRFQMYICSTSGSRLIQGLWTFHHVKTPGVTSNEKPLVLDSNWKPIFHYIAMALHPRNFIQLAPENGDAWKTQPNLPFPFGGDHPYFHLSIFTGCIVLFPWSYRVGGFNPFEKY